MEKLYILIFSVIFIAMLTIPLISVENNDKTGSQNEKPKVKSTSNVTLKKSEEEKVKAQIVLEINSSHPVAQKLKDLYQDDKDKLADYAKILYSAARLIGGMPVENPTELSNLICSLMI